MKCSSIIFSLLVITIANGSIIRQQNGGGALANKRIQNLDDDGKVLMSWEIDDASGTITFEVEAETTGYIGFGVSPQGGMVGADIFIAGVYPNGSVYSSDRHALSESTPVTDDHSDWELLDAQEYEGIRKFTYIKMSRKLNTCDEQDYPISNDTNRLIYAIGETDELTYHNEWKGTRSIHLLGAEMPPLDTDNTHWDYIVDMTMPALDTAYFCTIHKGPALTKKHHVIGFEAFLPDENSLRHTHHFVITSCYAPAGSNQTAEEIFGDFTIDKYAGDLCFKDFTEGELIPPFRYCQEFLYVWAKGGLQMAMPENVGYPIGPDSETDVEPMTQFYMLEVHYDNPNVEADLKFKTGVQMFYTEELRPVEAGMFLVFHDTKPSLLVPPNRTDFIVSGHCTTECTEHFPTDGITIFNSMLHSHLSGRKMKLRQFRDAQELPWVDYDDHYDFNYQQNKQLVQPRRVLQGDQLTVECTYNSAWKEGKVVIGDLSTTDEMCQVFMWYYPKMEVGLCGSSYPIDKSVREFGITEYDIVPSTVGGNPSVWIREPQNLAGDFEDSLNTKFANWTEEFIAELQRKRRYEEHEALCVIMKKDEQLTPDKFVKYPASFEAYVPDDFCAADKDGGGNNGASFSSVNVLFLFAGIFIAKLM